MSHRAAYHIQITKGKGSECFTASKTPVGHVMTRFRIVRNITPCLKVIVPDRPNFCKVLGRATNDGFKSLNQYFRTLGERSVEFMTSKDGIPILSPSRSIGSFVVMFFTFSYFNHMGYLIVLHVNKPHPLNIGKQVISILVRLSPSFDFVKESW